MHDCFDFKVHFTLRSNLPQCSFNFEGICYIISSDYSELFLFVFVCLIVAYAVSTPHACGRQKS